MFDEVELEEGEWTDYDEKVSWAHLTFVGFRSARTLIEMVSLLSLLELWASRGNGAKHRRNSRLRVSLHRSCGIHIEFYCTAILQIVGKILKIMSVLCGKAVPAEKAPRKIRSVSR